MKFKAFSKIERIGKIEMHITQKIHGSNAAVNIYLDADGVTKILCQSRTRIITPENDNFGFAAFVHSNSDEFIQKLGLGLHFGEWAGPGINSGEGLTEKTFVLFNFWEYPKESPLPPRTSIVPVLYRGKLDVFAIDMAMDDLKYNGSKLVLGFMRPEGVVVSLGGVRYKKVFEAEDAKWKKGEGKKEKIQEIVANTNVHHLLQPNRLEKLLSRNEYYMSNYPVSLPKIISDYVKDLIAEGEIVGTAEELAAQKKLLGKSLYQFVKFIVTEKMETSV